MKQNLWLIGEAAIVLLALLVGYGQLFYSLITSLLG